MEIVNAVTTTTTDSYDDDDDDDYGSHFVKYIYTIAAQCTTC